MVPNRFSAFTATNFPTRLFEYLALDRPVLAPSTQGIRDYFPDDHLLFFEPENIDDLVAKILWVHANPDLAQDITRRGAAVYRRHLWSDERSRFLCLAAQLLAPTG